MADKNYYDILGVDKSASKEEIKKAYKKMAKKYHPDISKEANAEAKFKEVNEAAGILLDDQKKSNYDNYGTADGPQGFGGFGGGGSSGFNPQDFGINIDDIFEQFGFGGGSGFSGFGGGSRRQKQRDTRVYSEVELTLDDVYFGVKKNIKVSVDVKCSTCNGQGAENPNDVEICSTCDGQGVVSEVQRSFLGNIRTQRTCPKCSGKGKTVKNPCNTCNGKGYENKRETIEVNIPKGIENGVTLRVSGKGNFNPDNNSYGDLYLKIYVNEDKDYDVDGNDLYRNLEINFIQATLGDEVEFKHFDKTLSLKIPAGTQSKTTFRLRGKGAPNVRSKRKGDQHVIVTVVTPSNLSKKQIKLFEQLEETDLTDNSSIWKKFKNAFKL